MHALGCPIKFQNVGLLAALTVRVGLKRCIVVTELSAFDDTIVIDWLVIAIRTLTVGISEEGCIVVAVLAAVNCIIHPQRIRRTFADAIGLEDVGFWTELLENCGLICMVQGGIIKELDLGQVQELHGGSGVMATHRNLEQVLTMQRVRQEHADHHQAGNCRIGNIPQWHGCDDK